MARNKHKEKPGDTSATSRKVTEKEKSNEARKARRARAKEKEKE